MKFLIPILFTILTMGNPNLISAHPIHVSVCEIVHDPTEKILKFTIKIFADDFEDVLEDRSGEDINLGLENEHSQADTFIVEYLSEKFEVDLNGNPVKLLYIGREIEDVAIWCYLYLPNVETIESITVRDEIMLHWFKDQVNVVHLDCNDKLNSTFFSSKSAEETFSFK